jgi:hypothetical protein
MSKELAGAIASFDRGNRSFGRDRDSDTVLSPDVLTPAQYYSAPVASPYHRLLLAILEDAIRCFQRNFAVRDGSRRILFRETEEWLFDSRGTAFMSCPMVCESLGIDPAQLRRYLHRWRLRKRAEDAPCLARRKPGPADPHRISDAALSCASAPAVPVGYRDSGSDIGMTSERLLAVRI